MPSPFSRKKPRLLTRIAVIAVAGQMAGLAAAAAGCGICATSVALNSSLAACFLERYETYASRDGDAVVVDLSDCPSDRGVVEALSVPTGDVAGPDLEFILARGHLACLREHLERPEVELDPLARISLEDCA